MKLDSVFCLYDLIVIKIIQSDESQCSKLCCLPLKNHAVIIQHFWLPVPETNPHKHIIFRIFMWITKTHIFLAIKHKIIQLTKCLLYWENWKHTHAYTHTHILHLLVSTSLFLYIGYSYLLASDICKCMWYIRFSETINFPFCFCCLDFVNYFW